MRASMLANQKVLDNNIQKKIDVLILQPIAYFVSNIETSCWRTSLPYYKHQMTF